MSMAEAVSIAAADSAGVGDGSGRRRAGLALLAGLLIFGCFATAGPRAALLMMVGLGFGLAMEGLRFGFTGPWRNMIVARDGRGLLAQLLAIALCAAFTFPLLAAFPNELAGAHAPVGIAMVAGAFVFGTAMQLVMGCGSGVLINAGSGNLIGALALVGFIAGSFLGGEHLHWWVALGVLPVYSLQGLFGDGAGLALTLLGLGLIAVLVIWRAEPGKRLPAGRLWLAGVLVAALAVLNLVIAGQPWGVVYGLGLWGAKIAQAAGMDVAQSVFWSAPVHAERLQQSLLTDVTSITNIGIIVGAFIVMGWRRELAPQVAPLTARNWVVMGMAGVVLGYSARIAFGCNVGAFFSGVSSGSLHGWVWFAAAFAGSCLGVRWRQRLMSPPARMEVTHGAP